MVALVEIGTVVEYFCTDLLSSVIFQSLSSVECGSSSILVKAFPLLVITTRFLSSSKLARPYIYRLIVLSRLTCPSTGPLLQFETNPW